MTTRHILQRIAANDGPGGVAQTAAALTDEGGMISVHLDRDNGRTASRKELHAHASRAAEEVKHGRVFPIDVGSQHVEQIFLGKVGGGTGGKGLWNLKMPPFVFSCNDSHELTL